MDDIVNLSVFRCSNFLMVTSFTQSADSFAPLKRHVFDRPLNFTQNGASVCERTKVRIKEIVCCLLFESFSTINSRSGSRIMSDVQKYYTAFFARSQETQQTKDRAAMLVYKTIEVISILLLRGHRHGGRP